MTLRMDLPHASYLCLVPNTVSVIISCKTPYFSVVENTARTLKYQCVLIPLGSPTTGQKQLFDHSVRRTVGGRTGGYLGGVWGLGGVERGNTRAPSHLLEEVPCTAKRAPEALAGLEWVVHGAGRALQSGPPCGPGRSHPVGPPCPDLRFPVKRPSEPQNGDISVNIQ